MYWIIGIIVVIVLIVLYIVATYNGYCCHCINSAIYSSNIQWISWNEKQSKRSMGTDRCAIKKEI